MFSFNTIMTIVAFSFVFEYMQTWIAGQAYWLNQVCRKDFNPSRIMFPQWLNPCFKVKYHISPTVCFDGLTDWHVCLTLTMVNFNPLLQQNQWRINECILCMELETRFYPHQYCVCCDYGKCLSIKQLIPGTMKTNRVYACGKIIQDVLWNRFSMSFEYNICDSTFVSRYANVIKMSRQAWKTSHTFNSKVLYPIVFGQRMNA